MNRQEAMTIDAAIIHAEEVANACIEQCQKEHTQLAQWLRELQELRQNIDIWQEAVNRTLFVYDGQPVDNAKDVIDYLLAEVQSLKDEFHQI